MVRFVPLGLLLAAAAVTVEPAGTPRWCYRTLAEVSCYVRPDPAHPDLLVGRDPPQVRPRVAPPPPPRLRGPQRLPGERDTGSD